MTRRTDAFDDFDFTGFWDESRYAMTSYTEPAPSDELVADVEAELGFRLPDAYVELARRRNGGPLRRNCFLVEGTGWSEGFVMVMISSCSTTGSAGRGVSPASCMSIRNAGIA
ncbi:SMI1/KNR4 family protein [Gordonia asplenii]|uniref:SMI1/KNR4 family protein n=1 Tax=Gordonia asplenii TaxID=2725283 RepID=UPI001B7D6FCA|nr:SMI1/KNR4 family protein [Gordonia asplenii]